MSLRSIRRAFNAALMVGVALVALAVVVDAFNLGPRGHVQKTDATLVTQPIPFGTIPAAQEVQPVTTIRREPRACPATALMPFGGSLTAGVDSYRGSIMVSMNQRRIPLDLVGSQRSRPSTGGDPDHEGYAGYTIGPDSAVDSNGRPASLSAVIESTIKKSKPDVVLILTGTDDLLNAQAAASLPSALTALITRMKDASPSSLLIIAELPPTTAHPFGSPLVSAYNKRAKLLADIDAFDSVFFAPTNEKLVALQFDPTVDLTKDQRQFTPEGGRKFTVAIEPVIAGAIVRDRSRRCVGIPKQRTKASVVPSTLPPEGAGSDPGNEIDESDFVIKP